MIPEAQSKRTEALTKLPPPRAKLSSHISWTPVIVVEPVCRRGKLQEALGLPLQGRLTIINHALNSSVSATINPSKLVNRDHLGMKSKLLCHSSHLRSILELVHGCVAYKS